MTAKEEARVLKDNEPFIRKLACKYAHNGVDVEDLYQEGCIGFLKALRNWKADGGASLQTYAHYQVVAHIQRAVGFDRKGKIRRDPIRLSLDAEDSSERTLHEYVPDASPLPDAQYERAETRRKLNKALGALSPRTVQVLQGRFVQYLTSEEVGSIVGLSRQRVNQIEIGALASLGKALRR
jgi:RNA polymerase sigma factor (sigma-70 family)